MAVITISREMGSGGDEIARTVAQTLDYPLVDKRFIEDILVEYGFVEFDVEYDSPPTFWARFDSFRQERREHMVATLNQLMEAVAKRGNVVIVGRSGFVVLSDLADVLNVRVQAPKGLRTERVAEYEGIDSAAAAERIDEIDKVRAAFIEAYYDAEWRDARSFDLVINTGRLTPAMAAQWIVEAARQMDEALPASQATASVLEVDMVMLSAVDNELQKVTA